MSEHGRKPQLKEKTILEDQRMKKTILIAVLGLALAVPGFAQMGGGGMGGGGDHGGGMGGGGDHGDMG